MSDPYWRLEPNELSLGPTTASHPPRVHACAHSCIDSTDRHICTISNRVNLCKDKAQALPHMYKGHNLTMGGGLAREGPPGKDLEAKLWGP